MKMRRLNFLIHPPFSPQCLEPIQSATRSLEKCVHLNEPQYMYGWRTDVVLLYYKCLVKLEKFNEAEELILKTVEDIYLISALEKKVAVNEQISPIRLLAIENSLHRLNLVLFGCEIRGMGQGRKISADPLNKIGWELSKLRKSSTPIKAKRDRPVWFDAAALTSGGSINATDAGGAPFPAHPEMPSRRHSIISLSRSDKIASPKVK